MKVVFGGVRGTSCVAQPEFARFGGDTTSLLVEGSAGGHILIDAGTGIRQLGERIAEAGDPSRALLLITHYHLDHVMGLPSLPLLYRPDASVWMASPPRAGRAVEKVVRQLMAQPYWPVQMEDLHATIRFLKWKDVASKKPFRFGEFDVRWCPVHHPGGCTAYRVDEWGSGASLVFATDIEWALSSPKEKGDFLKLCTEPAPAGLLVMDGQFNRRGYAPFKGWGHSTWEDTVDVARETGVGALLITHHAPENSDQQLRNLEGIVRKTFARAGLARVGQEIVL